MIRHEWQCPTCARRFFLISSIRLGSPPRCHHFGSVLEGTESERMTAIRCQRGHSMLDAYVRPNGWRECRTCKYSR